MQKGLKFFWKTRKIEYCIGCTKMNSEVSELCEVIVARKESLKEAVPRIAKNGDGFRQIYSS